LEAGPPRDSRKGRHHRGTGGIILGLARGGRVTRVHHILNIGVFLVGLLGNPLLRLLLWSREGRKRRRFIRLHPGGWEMDLGGPVMRKTDPSEPRTTQMAFSKKVHLLIALVPPVRPDVLDELLPSAPLQLHALPPYPQVQKRLSMEEAGTSEGPNGTQVIHLHP